MPAKKEPKFTWKISYLVFVRKLSISEEMLKKESFTELIIKSLLTKMTDYYSPKKNEIIGLFLQTVFRTCTKTQCLIRNVQE